MGLHEEQGHNILGLGYTREWKFRGGDLLLLLTRVLLSPIPIILVSVYLWFLSVFAYLLILLHLVYLLHHMD